MRWFFLSTLSFSTSLLVGGCQREAERVIDPQSALVAKEVSGSVAAFEARLIALQHTVEAQFPAPRPHGQSLPAGDIPIRELSHPAPIARHPLTRPILPNRPEPLGELLGRTPFPTTHLVALDDGTLFGGGAQGFWRWESEAQEADVLRPERVSHLQLCPLGERLSLTLDGRAVLLMLPDLTPIELDGHVPRGDAHWIDADRLLFFQSEIVDTRASSEVRILGSAAVRRVTVNEFEMLGASAQGFARMGTLPARGIIWAHLARAFQIEPMPAGMMELAGGETLPLTFDEGSTDYAPGLSVDGTMVWIRAQRYRGLSARAMIQQLGGGEMPQAFTAEKTTAVAITPRTATIVYTLSDQDVDRLYRIDQRKLTRGSLTPFDDYHQRIRGTAKQLQGEWAQIELKHNLGGLFRTDDPLLADQRERVLALFAERTEELFEEKFGLVLSAPGAATDMDLLLEHLRDHLPESRTVLAALGATIARAINPKAPWILAGSIEDFSNEVDSAVLTDQYVYTLVQPFGLARLVLAGEQRLADAYDEIRRAEQGVPVSFVENFEESTLNAHRRRALLTIFTNPQASIRLGDLLAYSMQDGASDPVVLSFAYEQGRQARHLALMIAAALRHAESYPRSPEAMQRLGFALERTTFQEEAILFHRLAAEMRQRDPASWIALGDALFAVDEREQAREAYRYAAHWDSGKVHEATLATRERLLQGAGKNP